MTTNYSEFQSQFFNSVAAVSSDVAWDTEFPLVIDRAEQRCYRDLDMLNVRQINTYTLAQSRWQTLPTNSETNAALYISIDMISVYTPVGASSVTGAAQPLVRTSPQFIYLNWPSDATYQGTPAYYAMVSDEEFIVGPPPTESGTFEVIGPTRPFPLSSGNSSTPLTQNYPDLFFCAAMIEAGAYMRFVEPQMASIWLQEYNVLLKSALVEEMRKRNMAEGWLDKQPSPVATPPRQ